MTRRKGDILQLDVDFIACPITDSQAFPNSLYATILRKAGPKMETELSKREGNRTMI